MDPFARIAQRVADGAVLVRRWRLTGGVSARVEALELGLPDATRLRVVVRQHGAAEWKPVHAEVAILECGVLEALRGTQVPVPAVRWCDTSGEILSSPYLVMDWVEGTTELPAVEPAVRSMADCLVAIHELDVDALADLGLPCRVDPVADALRDLPDDPEAAPVHSHTPLGPLDRRSLLHGDFWSGNVLWRDGQIVALVDWEDAAIGDPMSDLAGARVELLWQLGDDALAAFTDHYRAQMPVDPLRLALWEIYVGRAAIGSMRHWGLAADVLVERLERTRSFVERAARDLARLGA